MGNVLAEPTAGCNVIMNLIFIPFMGINGAAIATLLTQILSNFIIPHPK